MKKEKIRNKTNRPWFLIAPAFHAMKHSTENAMKLTLQPPRCSNQETPNVLIQIIKPAITRINIQLNLPVLWQLTSL